MIYYFLIDSTRSIQAISDLVLPAITDATGWAMDVSFKIIALYAFYTLLIRLFK